MSARYFLDTSVFVYSLDEKSPRKAARAEDLIRHGRHSGLGVVSYQVVQEFCDLGLGKLATTIHRVDLDRYLELVFRPLLQIGPSLNLFHEALQVHSRNATAWYDALIVAAAQQARCEVLYSEDFQHGQRFGDLRVENPFL